MLTISVELLQGTFRADPDGTANTGVLTRGEWPPLRPASWRRWLRRTAPGTDAE